VVLPASWNESDSWGGLAPREGIEQVRDARTVLLLCCSSRTGPPLSLGDGRASMNEGRWRSKREDAAAPTNSARKLLSVLGVEARERDVRRVGISGWGRRAVGSHHCQSGDDERQHSTPPSGTRLSHARASHGADRPADDA
jgi:hypothetical protein